MSDISFDTGAEVNFSAYRVILQETINDVLKKIKISDEGIKWFIVEEEKFKEMDRVSLNKLSPISPFIKEKNRYGCCDMERRIIWISTEAIHTAPFPVERVFPKRRPNLLVNVILDELTHIVTKRKHGDEIYEEQFESFKRKYYS